MKTFKNNMELELMNQYIFRRKKFPHEVMKGEVTDLTKTSVLITDVDTPEIYARMTIEGFLDKYEILELVWDDEEEQEKKIQRLKMEISRRSYS